MHHVTNYLGHTNLRKACTQNTGGTERESKCAGGDDKRNKRNLNLPATLNLESRVVNGPTPNHPSAKNPSSTRWHAMLRGKYAGRVAEISGRFI